MHSSRNHTRGLAEATALLLSVGALTPALAQTNPAANGGTTNDGDQLQEVIVTAEKRAEDVQKTPIAITTISGADLVKQGDGELDTALRDVPSLQVQMTPQGGEFYVRGVGANGDSNFIDPSVALMIDGVYNGRSERLAAPLYDINHIEVLAGPQGTLYGRDSDGGVVSVISNNPVFGSWDSTVNLEQGNYDLTHVDIAQNLPINDHLAFRVAAEHEDRHGYFTNDGYASHVNAFRVKGLYEPNDDLTVAMWYDYSHQYGHWATTVPASGPFAGPPSFVFNSSSDSCAGANGGWLDTQPNNSWYVDPCHPADTIDYKFETAAIQVDYRTPWATLTVLPAFLHDARSDLTNLVVGDDKFFGGSLALGVDGEDQQTLEVRLASPDSSRIKWVIGYFYLRTDNGATFSGTAPFDGTVGGATENLFNTTNVEGPPTTSKAPFGQVTIPLLDTLRLTGGVRYSKDSKSEAVDVSSVAVPGYTSGVETKSLNNSATTYLADLDYDLARESMLYAKVATGYKAGGFDTTATPPTSYEPEHVTDYELGIKNRWFNDSLQVNADLYYYAYHDLQVQYSTSLTSSLPIPPTYVPAGAVYSYFQQYVANAGNGINKGAELTVRYRFTHSDEVSLIGTYMNAHYGTFAEPALEGLSGERIAATPENVGIFSYEHDWSVAGGTLTAKADSKVSSSYFASVNNRAVNSYGYQGAYTRSDAFLTYTAPKVWSVSAWIKNIENKAQLQFGDFPLSRVVVNYPRTYGLNASFKF